MNRETKPIVVNGVDIGAKFGGALRAGMPMQINPRRAGGYYPHGLRAAISRLARRLMGDQT